MQRGTVPTSFPVLVAREVGNGNLPVMSGESVDSTERMFLLVMKEVLCNTSSTNVQWPAACQGLTFY